MLAWKTKSKQPMSCDAQLACGRFIRGSPWGNTRGLFLRIFQETFTGMSGGFSGIGVCILMQDYKSIRVAVAFWTTDRGYSDRYRQTAFGI